MIGDRALDEGFEPDGESPRPFFPRADKASLPGRACIHL